MDSLSSISTNAYLVNNLTNAAVSPAYSLLGAELSLATPALYDYSSTYVGISANGQALSAAYAFQGQMNTLQSAASGTQNFTTLSLQAQNLVSSFNTLQNSISSINNASNLPSGGVPGSANLIQSLNTQTLSTYSNGNSTLTQLSQIGITLQSSLLPSGSATLSLDTNKLQAAYNSDASGTAALLAKAANTYGNLAGNFVSQSGSQYASVDALVQSSLGYSLYSSNLLPQVQPASDFLNLLNSQSIAGSFNSPLVYAALSQYAMVSSLFG